MFALFTLETQIIPKFSSFDPNTLLSCFLYFVFDIFWGTQNPSSYFANGCSRIHYVHFSIFSIYMLNISIGVNGCSRTHHALCGFTPGPWLWYLFDVHNLPFFLAVVKFEASISSTLALTSNVWPYLVRY